MIKSGNIVYFREAKLAPGPKSGVMKFKGDGYAVFLGMVQPFRNPPPLDYIKLQMGIDAGLFIIDDLEEIVGVEKAKEIADKIGEKYMKRIDALLQTAPPGLGLVTPTGAPLVPLETGPET